MHMFIFNSFSLGFSSLCHSVVFVLGIFFLMWNRKLLSLQQSVWDKNEKTKPNQMKKEVTSCMEKGLSSVDEKVAEKWLQ